MAKYTLLDETITRIREGLSEEHKGLTDDQIDNTAVFLSTLGVGALSTIDDYIRNDVGFLTYIAANLLAPIIIDAINGGLVNPVAISEFVKEKEVKYAGRRES